MVGNFLVVTAAVSHTPSVMAQKAQALLDMLEGEFIVRLGFIVVGEELWGWNLRGILERIQITEVYFCDVIHLRVADPCIG